MLPSAFGIAVTPTNEPCLMSERDAFTMPAICGFSESVTFSSLPSRALTTTPRRPSASKWRISKAFRCGLEILTCNLEIEHQLQGDGSTFDSSYAFKSNRWEECVRKMARSAPRPPFGLPLSFSQAGKTLIFTPVRKSSGESGLSQGGDRLCGVGAAAAGALTASTRQGARPHQPLWKS
jgi:hypothetical protein